MMLKPFFWVAALALAAPALQPATARAQEKSEAQTGKSQTTRAEEFKPEQVETKGSVTVGGHVIDYDAYAGTLVVHPKGWDDDAEQR